VFPELSNRSDSGTEVRRARAATPESAALEAVRSVREQADQLEAFIRTRATAE
jgi:hypothetical protein